MKKKPNIKKFLKDHTKYIGLYGDRVIEDVVLFSIVDSEDQLINFRAGPVFGKANKKNKSGILPQPAIWIEYQEKVCQSNLQGSVLISLDVWEKLNKKIKESIKSWNKEIKRIKNNG